jgi:hypothetical protein
VSDRVRLGEAEGLPCGNMLRVFTRPNSASIYVGRHGSFLLIIAAFLVDHLSTLRLGAAPDRATQKPALCGAGFDAGEVDLAARR